jgi:hypothetical protein
LKLFSDLGFVLGTQRTLKMQAALSTAPVYSYFFAFDGGLGIAKLALQTQIEGKELISPFRHEDHRVLGRDAARVL